MTRAAKAKPAASAASAAQDDTAPAPVAGSLGDRIPRVNAAQSEALRELFAEPLSWPTQGGGALRFTGSDAGAADAGGYELDGDGRRCVVRFDRAAADDTAVEGLRWHDYAGRARTVAWGMAHEKALACLGDALAVPLLPVGVADDGVDADAVWLRFEHRDGAGTPGRCSGALRMPLAWLPRMLERAEADGMDERADELAAQAAQVVVGIEGRALAYSAWRALRRGDVLVLGVRQQLRGGQARANGQCWPLAATDAGWSVTGAPTPDPHPEDAKMQTHDTDPMAMPEGEPERNPAHDLPVQVGFDLGSVTLSLADLAALQPGYVFALPTRLEGANVTVRANGRIAGRGEVVAVGDTLGVRVLSWE